MEFMEFLERVHHTILFLQLPSKHVNIIGRHAKSELIAELGVFEAKS